MPSSVYEELMITDDAPFGPFHAGQENDVANACPLSIPSFDPLPSGWRGTIFQENQSLMDAAELHVTFAESSLSSNTNDHLQVTSGEADLDPDCLIPSLTQQHLTDFSLYIQQDLQQQYIQHTNWISGGFSQLSDRQEDQTIFSDISELSQISSEASSVDSWLDDVLVIEPRCHDQSSDSNENVWDSVYEGKTDLQNIFKGSHNGDSDGKSNAGNNDKVTRSLCQASDRNLTNQCDDCDHVELHRPALSDITNLNKSTHFITQHVYTHPELKRPKNGFIRYTMQHRKQVAREYPHHDNREISKILGSRWRRLSSQDKQQYEEEFRAEMDDRKQKHPDWRYGGCKQLVENHSWEPIPCRLRPRHTLKLRPIPKMTRPYLRRRQKACKVRWVQCDRCDKWRYLSVPKDPTHLPDKWFCEYNSGPYNDCTAEERLPKPKHSQPGRLSSTPILVREDHLSSNYIADMKQEAPSTDDTINLLVLDWKKI